MIFILIVILISQGDHKTEVAHRFFVGSNAEVGCTIWKDRYIKKVDAENALHNFSTDLNRKVGAATCVNTGLTILHAPWIKNGTRGLTPGLPGQPSF